MTYFNHTHLTERKQRELRKAELDKQILGAEANMRDLSLFLCSVSPDQTLMELHALRGTLRADTKEFAAVKKLTSNIREGFNTAVISLESKRQWDQILAAAEDVLLNAMIRRDEDNLRRLPKTPVKSSPTSDAVSDVVLGVQRAFYEQQQATPTARPEPSAQRSASGRLLSPKVDEYVSVAGTPKPTGHPSTVVAGLPPLFEPEVGRFTLTDSIMLPRSAAADNNDIADGLVSVETQRTSTVAAVDDVPDAGLGAPRLSHVASLSAHALAQREIRAAEAMYEQKLSDAQAQWQKESAEARGRWQSEKSELISNYERLDKLVQQQHAVETEDLKRSFAQERKRLTEQSDNLRAEVQELKEKYRSAEDAIEKLRQVIQVLTQRVESSDQRCATLEKYQSSIHSSLAAAVTATSNGAQSRKHSAAGNSTLQSSFASVVGTPVAQSPHILRSSASSIISVPPPAAVPVESTLPCQQEQGLLRQSPSRLSPLHQVSDLKTLTAVLDAQSGMLSPSRIVRTPTADPQPTSPRNIAPATATDSAAGGFVRTLSCGSFQSISPARSEPATPQPH